MTETPLGGTIGGGSLGPFGQLITTLQGGVGDAAGATTALTWVTSVVSSIIGVFTVVAGIWFLLNFIIGGLNWVSAGGDKHALEEAQKRITSAFIGLLIVVAGWSILALAGKFFGFDILISDPATIIRNLFPGGTPAQPIVI